MTSNGYKEGFYNEESDLSEYSLKKVSGRSYHSASE